MMKNNDVGSPVNEGRIAMALAPFRRTDYIVVLINYFKYFVMHHDWCSQARKQ